jgi:hypothetical protein
MAGTRCYRPYHLAAEASGFSEIPAGDQDAQITGCGRHRRKSGLGHVAGSTTGSPERQNLSGSHGQGPWFEA